MKIEIEIRSVTCSHCGTKHHGMAPERCLKGTCTQGSLLDEFAVRVQAIKWREEIQSAGKYMSPTEMQQWFQMLEKQPTTGAKRVVMTTFRERLKELS